MTTQSNNPTSALYARVARVSPDDHESGLATQLDKLRQFAQTRGWKIVGEFSEVACGVRKNPPRPAEVLQRANRHEFDILIVADLTRLSRQTRNLIEVSDQLKRHQVRLIVADDPTTDWTSPTQIAA